MSLARLDCPPFAAADVSVFPESFSSNVRPLPELESGYIKIVFSEFWPGHSHAHAECEVTVSVEQLGIDMLMGKKKNVCKKKCINLKVTVSVFKLLHEKNKQFAVKRTL